jgi:hypothetical protein
MATVRVTQRTNKAYPLHLSRPGGPLERHLELRALAVQAASKQRIRESPQRIDTGNLINSIQIKIYYRNGFPIARIGTDVEYSIYVHEGTVFMEANPFLRDGLIRGMQQFA